MLVFLLSLSLFVFFLAQTDYSHTAACPMATDYSFYSGKDFRLMLKMKKVTFPLGTPTSTFCGANYHVILDLKSLYRERFYLPGYCVRH
jgi:ubiquitin-protein ligase